MVLLCHCQKELQPKLAARATYEGRWWITLKQINSAIEDLARLTANILADYITIKQIMISIVQNTIGTYSLSG